MDVLADNPFVEAAALPFLAGIAFGLVLKLPWSARPLAATILVAVVSLVLAGTAFGVPVWPPNSATQKLFYIICLGIIIGLGSDWSLRRPAALIMTTILLTAAAFAWLAVGRLRTGGVTEPVIVATIVSALLAVGIIFTLRARVEGAPLEHHPFLVPGAVLVVAASTAIVSMLGAFLGMAQFLGGIAAFMGGYCLVGYVALLFGRAPVMEWGPGTEFLLLYVAGAGLILTTLLAPEASASALIILVLSLAGPALIAGPLGRFLPAHRLLRPLAAGFVIAIPAIIAVLVELHNRTREAMDRNPPANCKLLILHVTHEGKIMRRFIIGSVVLAGLAVMPAASFAAETYAIDPEHVWVTFAIKHGPWATVLGRFDKASGEIVFDRDDVTKSSVKATVDAKTINTNFARRDADLRGPDFLNAAEFPAITFVSTKIEKTGDKTGTITGDLTLTGITKPVALKATFAGEAPMGPTNHVGFSAAGEIDINDYQMKKAIQFRFGPKIEIRIEAEANKKK